MKSSHTFENSLAFAEELDTKDPLRDFRKQFHFPMEPQAQAPVYFVGNSLGLAPKKAKLYVDEELDSWSRMAVEGHFKKNNPWYAYHETVTEPLARVVGALPSEVVCMNTLTVNLHLMMVSFYRPSNDRFKIIIEKGAFSSDQYAVTSQIKFHGFDPKSALVELSPRDGEDILRPDDILTAIEREGSQLALVLLGNVNFRTGQAFDMKGITEAAHKMGAFSGFDLAHGAGNLLLKLHDWNVDFAVWCSYKYLNSGPGGLSGAFVHEKHSKEFGIPRFAGWWGHDKTKRFEMSPIFSPMRGAEGWQLSNPPVLPLATLRASLELFDQAGMEKLVAKSQTLTSFFEFLLRKNLGGEVEVITPSEVGQRGCHLSLKIKNGSQVVKSLAELGAYCDFRPPNVLRAAPVPLYNSFGDVFQFVESLKSILKIKNGN